MGKDNDDEQADEHGRDGQHHSAVAAAERLFDNARGQRAEEVAHNVVGVAFSVINARIRAYADVEQHKADGRSDAEADPERDSRNYLIAHVEKGQQHKHDALDEDNAQRCLERSYIAESRHSDNVADNYRKEAVESHTGCHRKRLVGEKRHCERTDCRSNAGCKEHAVPQCVTALTSETGQQVRVQGDDVGHRHERGKSCDDFGAHGRTVLFEFEQFFHFYLRKNTFSLPLFLKKPTL